MEAGWEEKREVKETKKASKAIKRTGIESPITENNRKCGG